jgi:CPA2 family monovalent cation:H+ antiporter-2
MSGFLLAKLKQPLMIGYILTGVIFGPNGLGFISSQAQIDFYSELGILLLLFVIGLELNVRSFIKMWKIPTLFTVIQITINAVLAVLISTLFSLPVYVALLVAFIASLSSTAAIVKVLEYINELKTDIGYITIGILVAQDIAIAPMMLVIKECGSFNKSIVIYLLVAIGLVVLLIKYLGKRERVTISTKRFLPNPELTPIITLGFCFAVSSIVELFGLSGAYGAFLAGLYIGNTQERQNILSNIKPIQNILLMTFFLSVGLRLDLRFLVTNWWLLLLALIGITGWKIIFNTITLRFFSIELAKATSIGIILAQLGEFSFVLGDIASHSQVIDAFGQKFIICLTALSLLMSPLFVALSNRTKDLSFVGDHSPASLLKILFSRNFARTVRTLSTEYKKMKPGNE